MFILQVEFCAYFVSGVLCLFYKRSSVLFCISRAAVLVYIVFMI